MPPKAANEPLIMSGNATETSGGGSVYSGDFSDGVPHGRGTKKWPSGDAYVGEWRWGITAAKDGKFQGGLQKQTNAVECLECGYPYERRMG